MNIEEFTLIFRQSKNAEYCIRNLPQKYYVYALKIGGDLYIGSSAHVVARMRQHLYDMEAGCHYNRYMNEAFLECEEVFGYILDYADNKEEVLKKEQYYIDMYEPYLNIGTANSKRGSYAYSLKSRIVLPKRRPVNYPVDKENYKKLLVIKSQHRIDFRELSYTALVYFLDKYYNEDKLSEEGLQIVEEILSKTDLDNF